MCISCMKLSPSWIEIMRVHQDFKTLLEEAIISYKVFQWKIDLFYFSFNVYLNNQVVID